MVYVKDVRPGNSLKEALQASAYTGELKEEKLGTTVVLTYNNDIGGDGLFRHIAFLAPDGRKLVIISAAYKYEQRGVNEWVHTEIAEPDQLATVLSSIKFK